MSVSPPRQLATEGLEVVTAVAALRVEGPRKHAATGVRIAQWCIPRSAFVYPPAVRITRVLTAALCLIWSPSASAGPRFERTFGSDDGLETGGVQALVQDSEGFLWMGGNAGLARYDGREFEPIAHTQIDRRVFDLDADGQGRVYAYVYGRGVWRLHGRDAVELLGPAGTPLRYAVRNVRVAPDESVWAFGEQGVFRYTPDATSPTRPLLGGPLASAEIWQVAFHPTDGSVYVGEGDRLWLVGTDGEAELLHEGVSMISDMLVADGALYVLAHNSDLLRLSDGRVEFLNRGPGPRGIALAQRGERVWVTNDERIGYVEPDGSVHWTRISAGGPMVVDSEGSLWFGNYSGLVQYPEPDTRVWGRDAGMSKAHARFVTRFHAGIAVTTWNEPGYVLSDPHAELVALPGGKSNDAGRQCVTPEGELIYLNRGGLARFGPEGVRWSPADVRYGFHCSQSRSGNAWVGYRRGFFSVPAGGEPQELVVPAVLDDGPEVSFEDSKGRLWVGSEEVICQADAAKALAGESQDWSCAELEGIAHATEFFEFEDGELWMGTNQGGLMRWTGSAWALIPESLRVTTQTIHSISGSAAGGVWLATPQGPLRVERVRGDGDNTGLARREHLTSWNGLPTDGVGDVFEDTDGSIWLATWSGLVRVPEQARHASRPAPRARFDGARSGGVDLDLARPIELPYGDNDLQLRFRAPALRDGRLLRFRMRLGPNDDWGQPVAGNSFNLVDLPPGDYLVSAQAMVDGGVWSRATLPFVFSVKRPWFWSPWPWFGMAAFFALAAWLAYRARVAVLLRMERQRMQIAMDLHDELGSGLGSIGLLANVAADLGDETGGQRELAEQIADTAASLGTSMSDIVWSLRPEAAQLQSLAARLHERAGILFPGAEPKLRFVQPDTWPSEELDLTARRNLYAVAVEAMHNAAKHARASELELFVGHDDSDFVIRVADDGEGFDYAAKCESETGGLGLRSMRLRVQDMGARLHVGPSDEGVGTVVEVRLARRPGQRESGESRLT
jgi:ligand-binding sensor domain-containing protein/two-component sensor histidine kinase